jgi:hypothetical protein
MKEPKDASDLIDLIYGDLITPRATVEVQTIVDSDRPEFEPVLRAMDGIRYNEFDGGKAAVFLRGHLVAEDYMGGSIIGFRFGREYSPVLYITITGGRPHGARLNAQERRQLTTRFMREAKQQLNPDSATVVGPGEIRLWWD